MNELYGRGIDSVKICDCLIPAFYETIKNDSTHLVKFKEVGLHTLEDTLAEKFQPVYNSCVLENIIDTSYRLRLTGIYKDKFLKQFRDSLMEIIPQNRQEALTNCFLEKLDSSLTIKETILMDTVVEHKILELTGQCLFN